MRTIRLMIEAVARASLQTVGCSSVRERVAKVGVFAASILTILPEPRQKCQEFSLKSRQGELVAKLDSLNLIRFCTMAVTQRTTKVL
jgi:hypothetical protein